MAQDSDNNINSFSGSLNKELSAQYTPKKDWIHARNAVRNSSVGDVGGLGSEPANKHLCNAPYPIIGFIYLYDDLWATYSTNDTDCELGIFKEFTSEYQTVVNDPGFNWNRENLITGVSRKNFDCSWSVYFADGYRNPDRCVNIENVPYMGTYGVDANGCRVFTPDSPLVMDTQAIKLNRPVNVPCLTASKGSSGGNLANGTYYFTVAYTVDGQKVTDYLGLSNAVSIFHHENVSGSLVLQLNDLDEGYDQFELVVVSIVNQQTVAKKLGLYTTNQHQVSLDILALDLPEVPLQFIPIKTNIIESSASISELSNNLIRVAPKTKFNFNYQPLANQITVHWTSVEYPADYYRNGGVNLNALRDENLCLFLRWCYDDGDKTDSYVIPGRAPLTGEQYLVSGIYDVNYEFENNNTATVTSNTIIAVGEDGYQIAEGEMGYHEIDEVYPDNQPLVWDNLCGKKIRLHKLPDRSLSAFTDIYSDTAVSPLTGPVIRVMGIKLYNIAGPVDNHGNTIPGIVGYEILRGSRQGNKTVIAKGILNHMLEYALTDDTGKKGLYPNYPYDSLQPDPFVSTTKTGTAAMTGETVNLNPNTTVEQRMATFHSPETMFKRPFLGAKELKLDGIVKGNPVLEHREPDGHPKHKMLTNMAFFISALAGIGYAAMKLNGSRSTSALNSLLPGNSSLSAVGVAGIAVTGISGTLGGFIDKDNEINNVKNEFGDVVDARDGSVEGLEQSERKAISTSITSGLFSGGEKSSTTTGGVGKAIGSFFRGVGEGGIALFVNYWSEGTDVTLSLIYALSQYQQYGLQQMSHCFYNEYLRASPARLKIHKSKYIGQGFNEFDENVRINNLYRASTVALKLSDDIPNPASFDPNARDISKQTLLTISNTFTGASDIHSNPTEIKVKTVAASYYASLKVRLRNQYGQVGNVKQIPVGCVNKVPMSGIPTENLFDSPVLFPGDTYITRYTEKNTMFFFYEWLYGQLDGFEYDYYKRRMLQHPAYWIDSQKFDSGDFIRGIADNLGGSIVKVVNSASGNNVSPNSFKTSPWLPTGFRALDRKIGQTDTFFNNAAFKQSFFVVKNAYFYLFNSSVKDFYVESEINLGYRDWEDPIQKRHYDEETFTDLHGMFKAEPSVIKSDNFYKYDYSLSIAHSFVNMASWGTVQPSYYDPLLAETCFVLHDKRVSYSLPQNVERIVDSWRVFLANNYREFKSKVSALKSLGLTGAVIFFENDSPLQVQGVETLELNSGTKVTIGDGDLLKSVSQNMTNADRPYQHGACRELRSIVNTPYGLFWMSPEQAKILTTSSGIINIAMQDMNWWFIKYLPYKLLEDFPDYYFTNNPVMGVGCQTVYDNESGTIYFTKRDFKVKQPSFDINDPNGFYIRYSRSLLGTGQQQGDNAPTGSPSHFGAFASSGGSQTLSFLFTVQLSDSNYFEDVSWTISYNLNTKEWVSYHDWHPNLVLPSKNTFMTIKNNGIWQHNIRCDKFANFYGVDFPFEVAFNVPTGLSETTLSSIEYWMEAYRFAGNCFDRYLYLDDNFDEAIVYNNEQCSGLLRLNLADPNNPFSNLQYPVYNVNNVDILYTRVENKYRFNMIRDLTDDRGQFTNARRMMFLTSENGYERTLNPVNLNYQKPVMEQKPMRGTFCTIFLRRKVCGDRKLIVLFSVNKYLESMR